MNPASPNDPQSPCELYYKYIEPNRYTIVNGIDPREYFDKLREQMVISADDTEEIMNKYHTRRTQAGYFLDVLQLKGNGGCQQFLDMMEYHSAEIFKIVTGKTPRDPPLDFKLTRFSLDLSRLNNLSEIIRTLQEQAQGNGAMKHKLEELEAGLLFAQNDKKELENETQILRVDNHSLTSRLQNLERNCGNLVEENVKLKDDSMEYLKYSLQLTKERDDYREKWSAVQHKLDPATREVIQLRGALTCVNCPNCSQDLTDIPIQSQTVKEPVMSGCDVNQECYEVEKQILKEERDEAQQNCEEITERMNDMELQLTDYQHRCTKLQGRLEYVSAEKDNINKAHMERKQKVEKYFERIKQLEAEKKTLEDLRIEEQIRANDESSQRIQLFKEKHELENHYDELKSYIANMKHISEQISLPEQDRYPNSNIGTPDMSSDSQWSASPPVDGPPNKYYNTLPATLMTTGIHRERFPSQMPKPVITRGPLEQFHNVKLESTQRPDSTGMTVHVSESIRLKQRRTLTLQVGPVVDQDAIGCYLKQQDNESGDIMTGATCGAGDAHSSGTPDLAFGFCEGCSPGLDGSTDRRQPSSEPSDGSTTSEESDPGSYKVITNMIPNLSESASQYDTDSHVPFTVKVPMPLLGSQLDITGGNATGIFIKNIFNKTLSTRLSVGDQVQSIVLNDNAGKTVTQSVRNLTQEQMRKVLQGDSLSPITHTVDLTCIHNKKVNQEALKWMKESNSNGDYFYTRSNFSWSGDLAAGQLEVNTGDIFIVLDTTTKPQYWLARKFDRECEKFEQTGYIPNTAVALRNRLKVTMKRSENLEGKGRRIGIRCKSEHYTMVLPVRALTKSPVLLFGVEKVVTTVQRLMSKERPDSQVDIMKNDLIDMHRHFPQKRSRHSIRKGSLTPLAFNKSLNIIIYLRLQNQADPEKVKSILDCEIDLDSEGTSEGLESRLQMLGLIHDTVDIPSPEVQDRASLVQCMGEKISQYQGRVYWLGRQSLTPEDLWKYQSLLCPSTVLNVSPEKPVVTRYHSQSESGTENRDHWIRSGNVCRSFSYD